MHALNLSASIRRAPTGLLLAGVVHVLVLWALLIGIGTHTASVKVPDMQATVITDRPPDIAHDAAPEPNMHTLTVATPPVPEIPIASELPPMDTELHTNAVTPTVFDAAPPKADPVVIGAAVDPRNPLTQPSYPYDAIRSNQEGTLALEILVGTDGRVRAARVAQTSGSNSLDQAALREARQRWRLRPATRDGVPFEQWLTLKVVFRLQDSLR